MATSIGISLPIEGPRGRLGYYRCRLGQSSIATIAAAIAQAEGAGNPSAIPARANNPGDLELGDIGYGTLTAAGGNQITVFPSQAAGEAALEAQINKMVSGSSTVYQPNMTISQAGAIYSGGSSNWAQNVASYLGVDPDTTTLGDLASATGTAAGTTTTGILADISSALGLDGSSSPNWILIALLALGTYLVADVLLR